MLLEVQESTGVTPSALLSKPTLASRWTYVYGIFRSLSRSRQYTAGGPAGIPFSEFYAYTLLFDITALHGRQLWEDLLTIDGIWLDLKAKQNEAKRGK
jgi:hypothetical protein